MPVVLLPGVLVFVCCEPAADAQGASRPPSPLLSVLILTSPATQIFVPLYERLVKAYHEWDGEEDMVTPAQVALMFVDWTDPIRAGCVSIVSGFAALEAYIVSAVQGRCEGLAQGLREGPGPSRPRDRRYQGALQHRV